MQSKFGNGANFDVGDDSYSPHSHADKMQQRIVLIDLYGVPHTVNQGKTHNLLRQTANVFARTVSAGRDCSSNCLICDVAQVL